MEAFFNPERSLKNHYIASKLLKWQKTGIELNCMKMQPLERP